MGEVGRCLVSLVSPAETTQDHRLSASSLANSRCGDTRSCAWSSFPRFSPNAKQRCSCRINIDQTKGGPWHKLSGAPYPGCASFPEPPSLVALAVFLRAMRARTLYSTTTLPMIRPWLFLVYLCQACTAFVVFPATTRLPAWRSQRSVLRPCTPRAVATARPTTAAPHGWSTRSIGRRLRVLSSSIGGVGEENVAVGGAGAAPEDDPFRPEKASVSPMVINAILSVMFKHVRRYAPRHPILVCWCVGFCT